MSSKINKFFETIWQHKKKSAFALALCLAGANALNSKIKNDEVRRFYGEKAKQYGAESVVKPTQKMRKVTVLINGEAGRQKAAQMFNRNALPLLNLAGLDVNVINVPSQSEMENFAREVDATDVNCIFLVGGDGAVLHALNGICNKMEKDGSSNLQIPIGIFPGGNRNKSFSALGFLQSSVDPESSVRLCCESAMALIEGVCREFYPIKATISEVTTSQEKDQKSSSPSLPANNTNFILSEIAAGWFEHCEQRVPKFWWLGPLKGYFACVWEVIKTSPNPPIRVEVVYEDFCQGCRKCLKASDVKNKGSGNSSSWSAWLFGSRSETIASNSKMDPKLSELQRRENPKCGELHTITISGTDIRLSAQQTQNTSKVRLHVCVTYNRLNTLMEAWRRVTAGNFIIWTEKKNAFETDIEAKRICLRFTEFPAKLNKLFVSGECVDFDDFSNRELVVEATRKPLRFFVPKLTGI